MSFLSSLFGTGSKSEEDPNDEHHETSDPVPSTSHVDDDVQPTEHENNEDSDGHQDHDNNNDEDGTNQVDQQHGGETKGSTKDESTEEDGDGPEPTNTTSPQQEQEPEEKSAPEQDNDEGSHQKSSETEPIQDKEPEQESEAQEQQTTVDEVQEEKTDSATDPVPSASKTKAPEQKQSGTTKSRDKKEEKGKKHEKVITEEDYEMSATSEHLFDDSGWNTVESRKKGPGKKETTTGSGSSSSSTSSNRKSPEKLTAASRQSKQRGGDAAKGSGGDTGKRKMSPDRDSAHISKDATTRKKPTGTTGPATVTPLSASSGKEFHVDKQNKRFLLISDVQGQLTLLNSVAVTAKASYVICTGNFGFYDKESSRGINENFLPKSFSKANKRLEVNLGDLHQYISGQRKLSIPVYTVWGEYEDVRVICKFRQGVYKVPNLNIIDEQNTCLIHGVRLFGLGGAVDSSKMVDAGDNDETIAGESGRMWTTLCQIGQLVECSDKSYKEEETRIFITYSNPFTQRLLSLLAVRLKADIMMFRPSSPFGPVSLTNSTVTSMRDLNYMMKEAATQIRSVWKEVRDIVQDSLIEAGEDKYLDYIRKGLKVLDVKPTDYYYGSVLHAGTVPLTSGSTHCRAFLTLNAENHVGLEFTCGGIDFSRVQLSKKRLNKPSHPHSKSNHNHRARKAYDKSKTTQGAPRSKETR